MTSKANISFIFNFAYSKPSKGRTFARFCSILYSSEILLIYNSRVTKYFKIIFFVEINPAMVKNSLTVSEITPILNKCSKFDLSWPLSEAWVVVGHLLIEILYILMPIDLHFFMKFSTLVVCSRRGATRPKPVYPDASWDKIIQLNMQCFQGCLNTRNVYFQRQNTVTYWVFLIFILFVPLCKEIFYQVQWQ